MKYCKALALASLFLLPVRAFADPVPTTPLLQAIQRAAGVVEAPATPVPVPLFPEKARDTCTVSVPCFSHCTLSCTGTTSCVGTSNSVTCDGGFTEVCPPACTWPNGCADVCGYCECKAQGFSASVCASQNC